MLPQVSTHATGAAHLAGESPALSPSATSRGQRSGKQPPSHGGLTLLQRSHSKVAQGQSCHSAFKKPVLLKCSSYTIQFIHLKSIIQCGFLGILHDSLLNSKNVYNIQFFI